MTAGCRLVVGLLGCSGRNGPSGRAKDLDEEAAGSSAPKLTLEHLAGWVTWQRVEECDLLGHLVARQLGTAVVEKHLRRCRRARAQDDEGHRDFAPALVRAAHHGR